MNKFEFFLFFTHIKCFFIETNEAFKRFYSRHHVLVFNVLCVSCADSSEYECSRLYDVFHVFDGSMISLTCTCVFSCGTLIPLPYYHGEIVNIDFE